MAKSPAGLSPDTVSPSLRRGLDASETWLGFRVRLERFFCVLALSSDALALAADLHPVLTGSAGKRQEARGGAPAGGAPQARRGKGRGLTGITVPLSDLKPRAPEVPQRVLCPGPADLQELGQNRILGRSPCLFPGVGTGTWGGEGELGRGTELRFRRMTFRRTAHGP